MIMHTAYLGLGSNIGDRGAHLRDAVEMINQDPKCTVSGFASLYKSMPFEMRSPNWFINTVVKVDTAHGPIGLLDAMQHIENELGRERKPSQEYRDRTIDIDILLYDDRIIETARLTVPHCKLHERPFVIYPLVELNPILNHPVLQRSLRALSDDVRSMYGPMQKVKDATWYA